MNNAFPHPPWDMVMPGTAQLVVTVIVCVVAAALYTAALITWIRTKNPIYLLAMIGGLVASLNEPLLNLTGSIYHPAINQWEVFEIYGLPIPVWAVVTYSVFFGGLGSLFYLLASRGMTRARFWLITGVVFAANAIIEVPVLSTGLYIYHGDHAYTIGGFPAMWLVINGTGAILSSLVILSVPELFRGTRSLLVIPLIPCSQLMALPIGLPYLYTLNTDSSLGVKYIGATATIILGIAALDAMARYTERRFGPDRTVAMTARDEIATSAHGGRLTTTS